MEAQHDVSAAELAEQLALSRHPEGGWFAETYRSAEILPADALPPRFGAARCCSTAILFLLEAGDFSALHRIKSDEIWHFHAGAALLVHVIEPAGGYRIIRLGGNITQGEQFQAVVPAGCWFGAESTGAFTLVGCTVAPGFDFKDFEMGSCADLCDLYPAHQALIRRLTR